MANSKKVFLGGTCNGSLWREELIAGLCESVVPIDPRVERWEKHQRLIEDQLRADADICVYVVTPKMRGLYTCIQLTEDSCKRPDRTAFCILEKDGGDIFPPRLLRNINVSAERWVELGATKLNDLNDLTNWICQNS